MTVAVTSSEKFLPKRADEGMVGAELETGHCFMMTGKEEGKFCPWSLSLMSFIAMENSSLSIFPSVSMSARFLQEQEEEERELKYNIVCLQQSAHSSCCFPLLIQ